MRQKGNIKQETKTMYDEDDRSDTGNDRALSERTASKPMMIHSDLPGSERTERRRKIRGGFLLGVGCVTSPCCTPLLVPLVLTLLAGTPLAAFLAQYVGWVYAGLTLVSVASLYAGVRHLWQAPASQGQESAVGAPKRAARQEEAQGLPVEVEA
jgi:hypothetical protein